jgi:NAD(P)-dependent dehydrogenase (short-subunit alcohol dehydrogenase family)
MNIVISGASKGIGRAIAFRFAKAGYRIAISARDEEALLSIREELLSAYPELDVLAMVADMSKKEEVQSFASVVLEQFGSIDILVNNAGIFLPGSIHEEAEGNLEKMIDTNLYSAYHLSRALLPSMKLRGGGDIFNICSIASIMAYSNGGSYAISKFALLGFSKCLREEMKPHGVRVCAVLPGATLTDSWSGVEIPEERFMPPEDIAEMIFATSQLSRRTVVEDILLRPQLGDL